MIGTEETAGRGSAPTPPDPAPLAAEVEPLFLLPGLYVGVLASDPCCTVVVFVMGGRTYAMQIAGQIRPEDLKDISFTGPLIPKEY